jgi:hypothetical protein
MTSVPENSRVLILHEEWLHKIIVEQTKTLELRGKRCNIPIGTIIYLGRRGESIGKVTFDGCIGPLEYDELVRLRQFHQVADISKINYKKVYGWKFSNIEYFIKPLVYQHKKGAQMWIRT